MHLADGSLVSMRQCIDEFAVTSKTRDGATIERLLKEKLNELQDIAEVERYKNQDDDIDDFCDDDLSGTGILDFGDDFPSLLDASCLQRWREPQWARSSVVLRVNVHTTQPTACSLRYGESLP